MTDTPYIDHREIKRARELSPHTDALEFIRAISPISTLLPEDQETADIDLFGYLVSADDKYIVARLVADEEAANFDREVLPLAGIRGFIDRVSRLGELEDAAVQAQADYIRVRRAFKTAMQHILTGDPLNKKDKARLLALHHELNQMDADCAADEARAREENNRHARERMRGIQITAAAWGLPNGGMK